MTICCKRTAMNAGEDIISDLPREIIDRILERMPIRDIGRTNVLSRKWRYIWATHPQLMLDHHFYKEITENKPFILQNFVNVINKIFRLHRGPILKFHLYIPSSTKIDENPDIDHWILILSRNGIKELIFSNASPHPYILPPCIYSCRQLTCLKLCNCIFKPPHGTDMLGTLFSSAPLLEHLFLISCIGIEHLNIHAPALKALRLIGILEFKSISFENCPNLTLLKVLAAGTVSKKPPAIKQLEIIRLININFNDLDQISCILCLLESSTNLQELNIRAFEGTRTDRVMQPFFNYLKESRWMDLKVNTVQTVKLVLYKSCSIAELFFIEFLLARCLILERVFIQLSGVDANEGFRISKELMRFPRASQKAKILFE